MANLELIALDEGTPQLLAPTSADTGIIVGGLRVDGATTLASLILLGSLTVDTTLSVSSGSITDSSGAIDFGNENLSTTGTLSTGALTPTSIVGWTIGTNVQAWDAQLDDIAALAVTDGNIIVGDGANWVVESGATARTSLGLTIGTDVQAVLAEGAFADGDKTKLDGITITGALTGDVTTVGNAATIPAGTVTYAKMQNAVANNVFLGNNNGAGTDFEELDATAALAVLGVEAGATADQTSIVGITGTTAEFNTANTDGTFATAGGAFHDGFSDYVAGEHFTQASITTVGTVTAGNVDAVVSAASTTTAGKVELATTAEVNTGTDTTRAVTADGVAGSYAGTKTVQATCFDYTTDVETGDGAAYIHVPASLNGMNLVTVHAEVITAGTTGTTDIQIANVTDATDMLSTKITIDTTETGSDTAATAAVINGATDDVATNDVLRIDVDAISTTAPKGLIVTLEFRLP